MLSGRYIHLHHALGLGPLWLRRGFHVKRHVVTMPSRPIQPHTITTVATSATPSTSQPTPPQQRLAPKVIPTVINTAPQPQPIATPQIQNDAFAIDIMLRTAYAFHRHAGILWLTLSPDLSTDAHSAISQSPAAKLIADIQYCLQLDTTARWYELPHQDDKQQALSQVIKDYQPRVIIVLGESIANIFALTHNIDPTLQLIILPHPLQLLRNPQIKKTAWQKLRILATATQA